VQRRRIDDAAVDGDAALHDHLFGVASRGEPCARQHLGDALAGLPRFRLLTGRALLEVPLVEVALALAVFAAAAERRPPGEDLAVILIVPTRPIRKTITRSALAALLPTLAAFGALTPRAVEFRAITAIIIATRPIEFRPIAPFSVAI